MGKSALTEAPDGTRLAAQFGHGVLIARTEGD
jgi:hypothetical protein